MKAILILTAFASLSFAADPVVTPTAFPSAAKEVTAAVDSLVTLTAPAGAHWQLGSEGKCGFWPDGDTCRFTASLPGRYLVLAVGDTTERFVIVVGKPDPMPPGPAPVPPAPVPPIDELTTKLKAAHTKDAASKADTLLLASRYTAAAAQVKLPTVQTAKQLIDAMKNVNPMPDKLIETQRVIAAELLAILKELDAPLTDAGRKAASELFTKAATVLEGLVK